MSHNLKHRVLLLLKAIATTNKFDLFNQAFELYKATPEKSPAVEVKLNRIGFTDTGLENLLYDLQKLHGITDTEIANPVTPADFKEEEIKIARAELFKLQNAKRKNKTSIKAAEDKLNSLISELDVLYAPVVEETPVIDFVPASEKTPIELKEAELKAAQDILDALEIVEPKDLVAISAAETKVNELEIELNLLKANPVPEESKNPENSDNSGNSDLDKNAEAVYTKTVANIDEEDGEKGLGVSEFEPIRKEYNFLNDADCPDEMYIVAGKAILAYRTHQKLHAKLQEVLAGTLEISQEEQEQLATDTHNAFTENRALWDEMNYYKEHKEIMGKHPLFRELVAKKEVEAMTTDQLAKYRTSSATFISKKKAELKKPNVTEEKQNELLAAIADREYRLGLVNTKLGADGKK